MWFVYTISIHVWDAFALLVRDVSDMSSINKRSIRVVATFKRRIYKWQETKSQQVWKGHTWRQLRQERLPYSLELILSGHSHTWCPHTGSAVARKIYYPELPNQVSPVRVPKQEMVHVQTCGWTQLYKTTFQDWRKVLTRQNTAQG